MKARREHVHTKSQLYNIYSIYVVHNMHNILSISLYLTPMISVPVYEPEDCALLLALLLLILLLSLLLLYVVFNAR